MNKIQIKAEILATISALSTSSQPNSSLITDLKMIEDKKNELKNDLMNKMGDKIISLVKYDDCVNSMMEHEVMPSLSLRYWRCTSGGKSVRLILRRGMEYFAIDSCKLFCNASACACA